MGLVFAGISPHPPLLIPEIGGERRDKVEATLKAEEIWAERLKAANPGRIVIISPHAPSDISRIPIFDLDKLSGDMGRFGCSEVAMEWEIDRLFVKKLSAENIPIIKIDNAFCEHWRLRAELDHGAFIPLYFAAKAGVKVPIVLLGYGALSRRYYERLGKVIAKLATEDSVPTAFIASGDLSHRLLASGPYGFNEEGPIFDKMITEAMQKRSLRKLREIGESNIYEAGQCGFNAILAVIAALESFDCETNFLSYEGPYGVGYAVCAYEEIRERG